MRNKDIKDILEKINSGHYTPEEEAIAKYWLHQLNQRGDVGLSDEELTEARHEMWQAIKADKKPKKFTIRLWPRIAAAASILLFLSFGAYFLLHKKASTQQIAQNQIHDIAPGGNKAILTLANGNQIILNEAKNGKIAKQGRTTINKTATGAVVYNTAPSEKGNSSSRLEYNMISTSRGGQFRLTLSDGTNVWLNAASSIKYPTVFNGNIRQVEITGEAYFEVVHNVSKPFSVMVNGQTVQVLGTHFNINAYKDEPSIKTTLIQGAVKVSKGTASAILKPGQQSVLTDAGNNSSISVSNHVNTDQVLAWTNGKFSFNDSDIKTVMRQIGRWYNVEIKYEGNVPPTVFSGEIYRNVNLSKALEILRFAKVNFRIEGREIIVTP
jgi:transmembrane sensor